ncbi:MAG: HDOD domain-containing protein [Desulfuromonadales bacterium]
MTSEKPIITLIHEHLAGDLSNLPVFNSVAVRLQQLFSRRDFSIEDVLKLISEDQSLSSKILKVANSSYYAGLSKIGIIKDAIVRLGAQEIANMAMMASQFDCYHSKNEILNRKMPVLWMHALACAVGAKWITKKAGYPNIAAEAFMGGLLHDIGKLALLKIMDDISSSGESRLIFSEPLVNEILISMHEEVGYNLMRSWNLPETYAATAIYHHKPDYDSSNILLVAVRLANMTCIKVGKDIVPNPDISIVSLPEVQTLGLKEITLAELEIVVEDVGGLAP